MGFLMANYAKDSYRTHDELRYNSRKACFRIHDDHEEDRYRKAQSRDR